MPRQKVPANVDGKPTEKTAAPQAPKATAVMDGIVKGIPRGVHTPMVDGVVTGLKPRDSGANLKVAPGATKLATQNFGAVPYQMGAFGR
jgi:hypothetical protein